MAQQLRAYILHQRPYRNTSLLLDCFTHEHGRVSVLALSARGPRSRFRGRLQPFHEVLLSWRGRTELKTLAQLDYAEALTALPETHLLLALHANELLYRLLQPGVVFAELYADYVKLLNYFRKQADLVRCRRVMCYFEMRLLGYLGYGLNLSHCAAGQPIMPTAYYRYMPQADFVRCGHESSADPMVFTGEALLAFAQRKLAHDLHDQAARRLLHLCFAEHLGTKKLNSLLWQAEV